MTTPVTPCLGLSALFDSVELEDHRQAAALCRTCPLIEACRANVPPGSAYPIGTWAGRLYGQNSRVVAGESFRECAGCRAVFIVSRVHLKYCSEACAVEGYRRRSRGRAA